MYSNLCDFVFSFSKELVSGDAPLWVGGGTVRRLWEEGMDTGAGTGTDGDAETGACAGAGARADSDSLREALASVFEATV